MVVKFCVHENWKCYLLFCTYTAYDRPRHAHYMYIIISKLIFVIYGRTIIKSFQAVWTDLKSPHSRIPRTVLYRAVYQIHYARVFVRMCTKFEPASSRIYMYVLPDTKSNLIWRNTETNFSNQ